MEEEERKKKEREEAMRAEKERIRMEEEERKKKEREEAEAEEKRREEEKKRKEEEEKARKEEEERRLEREREEAKKRQEEQSVKIKKEKVEAERVEHSERKKRRDDKAKNRRKSRRKAEREAKEKREEEFAKENFPEMYEESDSGSDSENSESESESGDDAPLSIKEQLKNFDKIASTGQLFLKYTGKRRRKPQDRIVKVSFDNKYKPKQISWGSGSRHIDFAEILYIAWGHWTPVFEARKDQLKEKLCFSVVGKQQILDVQAQSPEMAELWVKGLRKLIGHSDEKSDKMAKQALESGNLPGFNKNKDVSESKRAEREHKKRTKSLMLLQQDLFVMTTTTVFRNLEEERIWDIDQSVRERFNAKSLYELALREDIPWRQWNHWVREKIVTYLRENNRIANNFGGMGAPQQQFFQQGPQQGYGQPVPAQPQGYGQPTHGHHPSQRSFHQLPQQGYGQPMQQAPVQQPMYGSPQQGYGGQPQQAGFAAMPQKPVQLPPQPMNTNWNPPPNAAPMGGQPQQGAQGGDDKDCQIM